MRTLVTGGSGFIGSHVTDELVRRGRDVTVFDRDAPHYGNSGAEYIRGDICDDLSQLMAREFDVVFHLAAEVGSGLSMADPQKFFRTNSVGTANLLESMRRCGKYAKVILASSATVYGEATYSCHDHGVCFPDLRPIHQLEKGEWEVRCPTCGQEMVALPVREDRTLKPASIYGQSKLDQESTCLLLGRAWGFPVVALRLFGVFGPRQSLGNPYTGVLALFATRVLAGLPIMHYEDGMQNKAYIYIDDVVDAMTSASEKEDAIGNVFNIGSGRPVTIRSVAARLARMIDPSVDIISTGKFRPSDTRHFWPDTSSAQSVLKWKANTTFDAGLQRMVDWLGTISGEEIRESVLTFNRAERYARSLGLEV